MQSEEQAAVVLHCRHIAEVYLKALRCYSYNEPLSHTLFTEAKCDVHCTSATEGMVTCVFRTRRDTFCASCKHHKFDRLTLSLDVDVLTDLEKGLPPRLYQQQELPWRAVRAQVPKRLHSEIQVRLATLRNNQRHQHQEQSQQQVQPQPVQLQQSDQVPFQQEQQQQELADKTKKYVQEFNQFSQEPAEQEEGRWNPLPPPPTLEAVQTTDTDNNNNASCGTSRQVNSDVQTLTTVSLATAACQCTFATKLDEALKAKDVDGLLDELNALSSDFGGVRLRKENPSVRVYGILVQHGM